MCIPLDKYTKACYTIINPRHLGGGVLALGTVRFASRFLFWEEHGAVAFYFSILAAELLSN